MKHSNYDIEQLFLGWRKNQASPVCDTIIAYASSYTAAGAEVIDDGKIDQNHDSIDELYAQARSGSLVELDEADCDENEIKTRITMNAMDELNRVKYAHKGNTFSDDVLSLISKPFIAINAWMRLESSRNFVYMACLLAIVATGVSFLATPTQYQRDIDSIVNMDIRGELELMGGVRMDTKALGFSNGDSLASRKFDLGRTFSKLNYLSAYEAKRIQDAESLERILSPYEDVFIATQRSSIQEAIPGLINSADKLKKTVKPFLEDPLVYAGYWAQNLFFSTELESGSDIDMLMNQVQILSILEAVLNKEQYMRVYDVIQEYRNAPDSLNDIDVQMLGSMLTIWLG